ncbi:type 4 prepilin peptidase 1 [Ilumatobacter fluminis]|uniref:Type 4 prepilin peptidase 1 n=1 Tax=Ilumatobacter fluminis TaxID=467091 RepID=A0A4R7I4B6_9ACTN|nr:A24 family peptidase [Ilumatobacter fluminis]TDT18512.1 type 4 prepilin peptidase 1 [Ilumatobacter fluminis]
MDTTLVILACIVMGLLVGSFLTVVVDRVPRGGSVVAPPSACGACGHRLTAPDLVPIVSWVVLRGKCRHCGHPIGWEPIIIEVATATIFTLFGLEFGADAVLPAFWILGAALVALVWIDLREFRLPREITYTAFVLGFIALTVAALVNDEPERIWKSLVGAGIALAIMGLIYLGSRGQMGDGDVRLAPLLGLYLGYLNLGTVPIGLFLGFLIGAVVGVVAMAVGSAGRKTALPFGPFLALGTVVAIFIGPEIVDLIWQA